MNQAEKFYDVFVRRLSPQTAKRLDERAEEIFRSGKVPPPPPMSNKLSAINWLNYRAALHWVANGIIPDRRGYTFAEARHMLNGVNKLYRLMI